MHRLADPLTIAGHENLFFQESPILGRDFGKATGELGYVVAFNQSILFYNDKQGARRKRRETRQDTSRPSLAGFLIRGAYHVGFANTERSVKDLVKEMIVLDHKLDIVLALVQLVSNDFIFIADARYLDANGSNNGNDSLLENRERCHGVNKTEK
jgi:hypothetical protein